MRVKLSFKHKINYLFLIVHTTFSFATFSQPLATNQSESNQSKPDYLFPIKPGKQNFLSGSMGELRPGHFHAGIDIKTEGKIGLPVYATASGYIYRVRVSPRGYGRALYLQHDDGTKSLYGHLEKFDTRIEKYVLESHYRLQKSNIDVYPAKNKFRFNKGDIIAYGGNTGSSGGPHLHFEIRQPNDAVINPLQYNFSEIKDNIAPIASRVALVSRGTSSRINGTFGRLELPLYRSGRVYRTNERIQVHGTIGVEFQGVDRANLTSNTYGINKVVMEVNGQEIYRHEIALIPFEVTRMINLFTNYPIWESTNKRFQRCYKVDGNQLPFYEESPSNGFFVVPDSGFYQLNIHLYDSYENHSVITLQLEGVPDNTSPTNRTTNLKATDIYENTYTFMGAEPISGFYLQGEKIEKEADYQKNGLYYFLWDLRLGLPDSVINGQLLQKTNLVHTFYPYANTTYFHQENTISVPKRAIHDTLYLNFEKKDDIYLIGDEYEPLFGSVRFTIQPDEQFQDNDYHVYRLNNRGKPSFVGGEWNGKSLTFSTRNLGRFTLLKDQQPPSIRVLRRESQKIVCRIDDTLSGIKEYKASINGEWLLMLYDYRRKLIWSEKRDNEPLKGNLTIEVTDNAGNKRTYNTLL